MAKPQHSAALDSAIFDSPLLFNLNVPTTAHSGNVRAVGVTLTHALWTMTYASATHIKRREGVWGIVKEDKGGASQVAPLSPLKKKQSMESQGDMKTRENQRAWNLRDVSLTLNMTTCQQSGIHAASGQSCLGIGNPHDSSFAHG